MFWKSPTLRILAGLLVGLAAGGFLASVKADWLAQATAATDALGGVWLDSLRMTIIPLVFGLLVVGVAQTAGTVRSGGLAGKALITFALLLLLSASVSAIATAPRNASLART